MDLSELLQPGRVAEAEARSGYIDLLGGQDPTGSRPGQRLMTTRLLPEIYERFWRPVGARLLVGLPGPGGGEEHRMALEAMSISPGDRVLDVACGPGNFTRDFATASGDDGLVVGLDASETMLEVAVRETARPNVAYVRGDAADLPFRDASFDAVSCFAALYLIEDPMRAVAEIARVLVPGGRVALLSTCARGPLPAGAVDALVRRTAGVRIFDREELTMAMRAGGIERVRQRVSGFAQFVSGRKRAKPSPVGTAAGEGPLS